MAAWSWTGWDEATMEPWASAEGFRLRGDYLWSVVLHAAAQKLVVGIAIGTFVVALVVRWVHPHASWPASAIAVVVSMGISSLIVGVLKDLTNQPCPWDLARWGGSFVPGSGDEASAAFRGWPAAHASAGFGWIALYFAARWHERPRAWLWLSPALLLGLLFAATQHVRGAHFPSHNAWALLIAWLSAILVHATRAALAVRRRKMPPL